jgi:hypothetical protein
MRRCLAVRWADPRPSRTNVAVALYRRDAMDAAYYDRKAAEERARLSKHLKERAKHERAAADADKAALKAEQAASRTKSQSVAKNKLRDADRKRDAAVKSRERAAKASADAAGSQKRVTEYETKAADARARQAKRDEAEQKRAARRAAGEQRRGERETERLDRARTGEVADLRDRTAELESQLEAARRAAPSQITVLLLAGTPEGGHKPLRLDREIREIDTKIRVGEHRDQIHFQQAMATQVSDIIDALNRFDPDVVHFSGHGGSGSPDLRAALANCAEAELADLLIDFDVTATYDKTNRRLKLGATLTPELVAAQEAKRPPGGRPRSRISSIAGAGFEPATFGL